MIILQKKLGHTLIFNYKVVKIFYQVTKCLTEFANHEIYQCYEKNEEQNCFNMKPKYKIINYMPETIKFETISDLLCTLKKRKIEQVLEQRNAYLRMKSFKAEIGFIFKLNRKEKKKSLVATYMLY